MGNSVSLLIVIGHFEYLWIIKGHFGSFWVITGHYGVHGCKIHWRVIFLKLVSNIIFPKFIKPGEIPT
jgi:hypothetical protein